MKKTILFCLIAVVVIGITLLGKTFMQRLAPTASDVAEIQAPQIQQTQSFSQPQSVDELPGVLTPLFEMQAKVREKSQNTAEDQARIKQFLLEQPVELRHSYTQPEPSKPTLKQLYQEQSATASQPQTSVTERTTAVDKNLVRQKFIEGLEAFNQEDFKRAIDIWTQASELDPTDKDVEMALRKVKEITGQTQVQ